jgi:hypothetical protein
MTSVLYRIEDKTKNNSFKIDDKSKFIKNEKFCWFCQRPCFKFVSICTICENERILNKKNKKKDNN